HLDLGVEQIVGGEPQGGRGRHSPVCAQVDRAGGVENPAVEVVVEAAALPAQVGGQGQTGGGAPVEAGDGAPDRGLGRAQAGKLRGLDAAVDAGVGGRQGRAQGDGVAQVEAAVDLDPRRLDGPGVPALAQDAAGGDEAGAGEGSGAFGEGDVDNCVLDAVPEHRGGQGGAIARPGPAGLDAGQPLRDEGGI